MSTSSQSFEEVRSILSKLDRDIEAARARRLNTGAAPRPRVPPTPSAPATQPEPPRKPGDPGRSGYGVARPLRRDS